jgi:hypothetical protein
VAPRQHLPIFDDHRTEREIGFLGLVDRELHEPRIIGQNRSWLGARAGSSRHRDRDEGRSAFEQISPVHGCVSWTRETTAKMRAPRSEVEGKNRPEIRLAMETSTSVSPRD